MPPVFSTTLKGALGRVAPTAGRKPFVHISAACCSIVGSSKSGANTPSQGGFGGPQVGPAVSSIGQRGAG